MKINIIIATYNRCHSLQKTLKCIAAQKNVSHVSCDVIVVDNNSTDDTKTMIERMQTQDHLKITYLRERKQRKVYALNKALESTDGDIIAFTDDDVLLEPDWLDVVVQNFKDNSIDCLTGKIVPVYDEAKPEWYSDKMATVLGRVDYTKYRALTPWATGANMAIKREVLDKVGRFDVYRGLINEDTLVSQKIKENKFNIFYDPKMMVYHCFQKEKFNKTYFRKWYLFSGRALAEIEKQRESRGEKEILGIKRWRFKKAFIQLQKMILNLRVEKERFFYELQLCRFYGFCSQTWFGKNARVK